jgi:hypothetical protein
VRSQSGHGTSFVLTLSASAPGLPDAATPLGAVDAGRASCRVLLVEDDGVVRMTTRARAFVRALAPPLGD